MDVLPIFICIIGSLILAAAVLLPATSILAAGNRDSLAELMAAHERNLRSEDPKIVADSIERWGTMCRFIKESRHTYHIGVSLEEFGREAERMLVSKVK